LSNSPLVSVFITSYNQEDFIGEAVKSVAEQDYQNVQIVISDDGSTDSSPLILKELSKKYPKKIEIHLHKENRGSTWNHNYAFQHCWGEYICYFDGDDIMLPGKIRKQLEFMRQHPKFCLTYHNVELFESNSGKTINTWKNRFGARTGSAKELVRYGNFLPSLSIMFEKNTFDIEFNQEVSMSEDWFFFIEYLQKTKGKIGYLNEILGRYRRHRNNIDLPPIVVPVLMLHQQTEVVKCAR